MSQIDGITILSAAKEVKRVVLKYGVYVYFKIITFIINIKHFLYGEICAYRVRCPKMTLKSGKIRSIPS